METAKDTAMQENPARKDRIEFAHPEVVWTPDASLF
jgi:hypothetical protein